MKKMKTVMTEAEKLAYYAKQRQIAAGLPFRCYEDGDDISEEEMEAMRKATDDELKIVFSDPTLWSFVVRNPAGYVAGFGGGRTAEKCEDDASALVGDFVARGKIYRSQIIYGNWRLLLWPPTESECSAARK